MKSILSLRRSLWVLVVVAGLGLAPAVEARVPGSSAHSIVHRSGPSGASLAHLWHVLHGLWEAVGSSMDPLGNH